jgi:tRNA U38,U39,U40 pseudouridine synthase TruA
MITSKMSDRRSNDHLTIAATVEGANSALCKTVRMTNDCRFLTTQNFDLRFRLRSKIYRYYIVHSEVALRAGSDLFEFSNPLIFPPR